jgi:hypothetical protein
MYQNWSWRKEGTMSDKKIEVDIGPNLREAIMHLMDLTAEDNRKKYMANKDENMLSIGHEVQKAFGIDVNKIVKGKC